MLFLLPSVKRMTVKDLMAEFLVLQSQDEAKKRKLRARRVAVAREIERRMSS